MPISPSWHDESHTIIYVHYEDVWTWDDFHRACDKTLEMANQVDHQVDLIVNIGNSRTVPPNTAFQLERIRAFVQHPSFGLTVMVGMNPVAKTFFDILLRFAPQLKAQLVAVKTVEKACTVIEERRPTSSNL